MLGAIAEFEKTSLVAKLRAARERKKAQTGNCGGRQSHAEARPEVVALVRRCSSFGIDFLAIQQRSWAVKPSWLCMRVTERVWRCMAQARSW